jgi:hypothetical protein
LFFLLEKTKNTIKVDTKRRRNVYMKIQIFLRQFEHKCLFIILNGRLDLAAEFNSIKVDLLILIRVVVDQRRVQFPSSNCDHVIR